MVTKFCPHCKTNLDLSCFGLRSRGTPVSYCKQCVRDHAKAHYQLNKATYADHRSRSQSTRRVGLRAEIAALKKGPCMDCGETHPSWAMDFDHRDPSTKEFSIACGVSAPLAKERILTEIDKCDLVCALCHRYRTHGVRRSLRLWWV